MFFLKIAFLCAALACLDSDSFVQGDVSNLSTQNPLDTLQKQMELFKNCIDHALAKTVDEVNVKQVQPVFEVLGDQLNRFSKAFEDLTAKKTSA